LQRDAGFNWLEKFDKKSERWPEEAVLNTSAFFKEYIHGTGQANKQSHTLNLIDARYGKSFSRWRADWVFAIDMVCPENYAFRNPMPGNCRPKLRMVEPKPNEDKFNPRKLPVSLIDYTRRAENHWSWREADIRSCKGALAHLLDFPEPESSLF